MLTRLKILCGLAFRSSKQRNKCCSSTGLCVYVVEGKLKVDNEDGTYFVLRINNVVLHGGDTATIEITKGYPLTMH